MLVVAQESTYVYVYGWYDEPWVERERQRETERDRERQREREREREKERENVCDL